MKRSYKKILYAFCILLTVGVVVWIYLSDQQLQDLGTALSQVNLFWILVAVSGMFLYWIFDTGTIRCLSGMVRLKLSWPTSLKIALIGQFYGSLTPSGTGAQPSQIVFMNKKGVSASQSTPMLVSKFLLWQIVEGIVSTVSIPYCWSRIESISGSLVAVALVGYVLNSFAAIGGILIMINKNIITGISRFVCKIGVWLRLIHNNEKWMEKSQRFIFNYGQGVKLMLANRKKAIVSVLLVFGQIISYFIITYFVYLACTSLPFSFKSMLDVFFMQSVLTISVNFIPLPGATGTSEGGFYLLFGQIFPKNMVLIGMIIWRFITYYFNLIGGLLAILSGTLSGFIRSIRKRLLKSVP